ncbi:MAG: hypothetical protein U5N86_04965 [Planctomycetota bacterium]|nr:hypothetical protein [Planctomycetota bacterium]
MRKLILMFLLLSISATLACAEDEQEQTETREVAYELASDVHELLTAQSESYKELRSPKTGKWESRLSELKTASDMLPLAYKAIASEWQLQIEHPKKWKTALDDFTSSLRTWGSVEDVRLERLRRYSVWFSHAMHLHSKADPEYEDKLKRYGKYLTPPTGPPHFQEASAKLGVYLDATEEVKTLLTSILVDARVVEKLPDEFLTRFPDHKYVSTFVSVMTINPLQEQYEHNEDNDAGLFTWHDLQDLIIECFFRHKVIDNPYAIAQFPISAAKELSPYFLLKRSSQYFATQVKSHEYMENGRRRSTKIVGKW